LTQVCHNINRVVYVFGEELPGPIEDITPTVLTKETVARLQEADSIVNDLLYEHSLIRTLSQVPVILFPVGFGKPGNHSVAIRPFITSDFMTGLAAVPGKHLPEDVLLQMVNRIEKIPGISRVAYDLTSKPPGTTEWE
jgi:GMP synthase (glutamine-hydrolysing)